MSLSITTGILFLPYFYYSSYDTNSRNLYEIEKFSLNRVENDVDSKDILDLLALQNAIRINNNEKIETEKVKEMALSAIETMGKYMKSTNYEKNVFDISLFNDMWVETYNTYLVSGMVNDKMVTVSLIYINLSSTEEYAVFTLDTETKKIYQLYVGSYTENYIFYDEETKNELNRAVSEEEYDKYSIEIIDKIYDMHYQNVCKDLCAYWDLDDINDVVLYTYGDHFSVNVFYPSERYME